ncbi:MAG: hypothetical protein JWS10_4218 [Cypionkella sp.]|uniref:sulfotransferase family protein n=1 Tax=Cypionkella sp. TaxID=2811411 RepID=UPI002630B303|nr:hypothetical protein [Cypionkella sp.]MDB5661603.1 hypothetical protein [Cypionkella sp.]
MQKKREEQPDPNVTIKGRPTCLLVLGMHRSGTSALAGTLGLAGCDQPKTTMVADVGNPKGYFESRQVYELHKDIMSGIGATWDDWLPLNDAWVASSKAEDFCERAVEILRQEYGSSRLFVLKDPRICRLVPFWRKALSSFGATTKFVHIHRHPFEVADSLKARNDLHPSFGKLLWLRYTLDAERATRGENRVFVSYQSLLQRRHRIIEDIETKFDDKFPIRGLRAERRIDDFLTVQLKHKSWVGEDLEQAAHVPAAIRTSFAIFEKWVRTGEDAADFNELDGIHATLNEDSRLFADLVQDGQRTRRLLAEAAETASRMAAMTLKQQELTQASEAALAQSAKLSTELVQVEAEAAQAFDPVITQLKDDHKQTIFSYDRRRFEQEKLITSLKADLRTVTTDRDALSVRVRTQSEDLGRLAKNMVAWEKQHVTQTASAKELIKTMETKLRDFERCKKNLGTARIQITRMTQSTSWRVTKPLRGFKRLVRWTLGR